MDVCYENSVFCVVKNRELFSHKGHIGHKGWMVAEHTV